MLRAHTHGVDEDGPYPDYMVWEEVPPPREEEPDDARDHFRGFAGLFDIPQYPSDDFDDREPAVCVDTETIDVYVIKAAKFSTSDHRVSRRRIEMVDPKGPEPDF
ncbi:MAG: hypothetical protein R3E82_03840 [Pseudomonadales bacterium]